MGGLSPELLKAIDPPLRQVRRALRELDPKELPASLHKVAATEGGRLPPPLLARLLGELDENVWLRERLAEQLGDRIEPPTERFLARADGWWIGLAEAAVAAARTRPPDPAGDVVAGLEEKLALTKARLGEVVAERDRLKGDLKAGRPDRARLAEAAQLDAQVEALRTENRRLAAALAAEVAEREASERRVAELRRRARPTAAASGLPTHPRPRAVGMGDPTDVARRLDTEVAALAAGVAPAAAPAPGAVVSVPSEPPPPLRLPPGIAPDRPEAVRWVLSRPDPALVVVDGYNVTYLVDPVDFHGGAARRRLVSLLGRLASRRPHRLVVVFDSDQPPGTPARMGDVEVMFTSGEKADDRIVALAGPGDLPVAVVTNDRDLRERVEAEGSLAVWADALVPLLG